ncbi:C-X-C motif chemokine ligand 2 [Rhinolophus ferrumequinum]|uniref:C-X-C motif chemokine n=1 Tax=Rhinolophus ferrumequinum TaxID=59479 RepID=A0A7J7ZD60_RHIFE|nr:C-X-C motif chemokine ligand 2 [Rhinolophus ferrumequinum]
MARTATAATPCAPRLLRAALLLPLLVAACRRAAGAPVVTELRCQCLKTLQGIHIKNIQSVKVTPPAPHCDRTEVIVILKDGQEVCLNPAAPLVKKIIAKMLKKAAPTDQRKQEADPWLYLKQTLSLEKSKEKEESSTPKIGQNMSQPYVLSIS